jgi:repressor of nif and glnA expression
VKFEWLQVILVVRLPNLIWVLFDRGGAQRGGDTIASPLETNSRLSQDERLVRKDLRSLLGKRLWTWQILLNRDIDDRGVRMLQAARVFAEIPLQKALIDSHAFFSPSKMDGPLKFDPRWSKIEGSRS